MIKIKKIKPTNTKIQLLIVGLGGTGGHLVHNLLRLMKYNENFEFKTIFADADTVEIKNLGRQNFFMNDIGKNKAEVLANRYAAGFGISIQTHKQYIEDEIDIERLLNPNYFPIIISCVDNLQARQVISDYTNKRKKPIIYIDSGNLKYNGQIVLGTGGTNFHPDFKVKLKTFFELYPDLYNKDAVKKSDESCDDAALEDIQTITANLTSANAICQMMANLLSEDGLNYSKIEFDAKTSSSFRETIKGE